ncbi:MAG: type IV-A pilus assembly ATPase PilB, partial [Proteobacteria bacterium]|nr:type IV-A pilus assembly ATPase PilB [Pseudomonadota bacterium]
MNLANTKIVANGTLNRLIKDSLLSQDDAILASEKAKSQKINLYSYLVENEMVGAADLASAASVEYGVPLVDVTAIDLTETPKGLVDESLIEKHQILPLYRRANKVYICVSDPANTKALDEIRFHTNLTIEPILVQYDKLLGAIDEFMKASSSMMDELGDEGLENLDFEEGIVDDTADDTEDLADTP